jgi:glutamate synthase (NADPH/NADH) large chain
MTGGLVAILGPVMENFGAGMTGGMAFVYDAHNKFELMANADTIIWRRIASAHWDAILKNLIKAHVAHTGSVLGQEILSEWETHRARFWQICPKEMLTRLSQPLDDNAASAVAAQ